MIYWFWLTIDILAITHMVTSSSGQWIYLNPSPLNTVCSFSFSFFLGLNGLFFFLPIALPCNNLPILLLLELTNACRVQGLIGNCKVQTELPAVTCLAHAMTSPLHRPFLLLRSKPGILIWESCIYNLRYQSKRSLPRSLVRVFSITSSWNYPVKFPFLMPFMFPCKRMTLYTF